MDRDTKIRVIDYIRSMRGSRILLVATHGAEDASLLGAKIIRLEELLGVLDEDEGRDEEKEIALTREQTLQNLKLFNGIPASRYSAIIEKLDGYETEYYDEDVIWGQGEHYSSIGIILRDTILNAVFALLSIGFDFPKKEQKITVSNEEIRRNKAFYRKAG